MSNDDKLMKEVEDCRVKLIDILDDYDCYLTITDGTLFVEKQLGHSVRAVEIDEILL